MSNYKHGSAVLKDNFRVMWLHGYCATSWWFCNFISITNRMEKNTNNTTYVFQILMELLGFNKPKEVKSAVMVKLLALGQCVPNCTFELDQIPCLNSLSFTRTAAPGSHGVISQQQLTPPVTPRSQATFSRWIWLLETLSTTLSYLILQFINFTFFFLFNYYFVSQ